MSRLGLAFVEGSPRDFHLPARRDDTGATATDPDAGREGIFRGDTHMGMSPFARALVFGGAERLSRRNTNKGPALTSSRAKG